MLRLTWVRCLIGWPRARQAELLLRRPCRWSAQCRAVGMPSFADWLAWGADAGRGVLSPGDERVRPGGAFTGVQMDPDPKEPGPGNGLFQRGQESGDRGGLNRQVTSTPWCDPSQVMPVSCRQVIWRPIAARAVDSRSSIRDPATAS